jgi:hypothetical protein
MFCCFFLSNLLIFMESFWKKKIQPNLFMQSPLLSSPLY